MLCSPSFTKRSFLRTGISSLAASCYILFLAPFQSFDLCLSLSICVFGCLEIFLVNENAGRGRKRIIHLTDFREVIFWKGELSFTWDNGIWGTWKLVKFKVTKIPWYMDYWFYCLVRMKNRLQLCVFSFLVIPWTNEVKATQF